MSVNEVTSYSEEEFNTKRDLVLSTLKEMAAIAPGGGLYIKDIDCGGGIYSLNDIDIDDKGNIRLKAYMWEPSELALKTGYFRD